MINYFIYIMGPSEGYHCVSEIKQALKLDTYLQPHQ